MADYILETKDLGITFGGLKAAQNVNIRIEKNQIYGLIGPNGAGKTTIFNLLTGVYKPTSGTFYLDGEELKGAKKVLKAAALTYVAALATSLAQILRLLLIAGRRRD